MTGPYEMTIPNFKRHILQYHQDFQSNGALFPSFANIQPYFFSGKIKLIICRIEHYLAVTIHEMRFSWKKEFRWRTHYYMISMIWLFTELSPSETLYEYKSSIVCIYNGVYAKNNSREIRSIQYFQMTILLLFCLVYLWFGQNSIVLDSKCVVSPLHNFITK